MNDSQTRWDLFFLDMVETVSKKSKDPSTKVGAVVVGPDHEVRSIGFNGFPRGVDDTELRYNDRDVKYMWVVHAEQNCVFNSSRSGIPLKGCTMYLDWHPCNECAKAIIQAGITRLVISGDKYDARKEDLLSRWGKAIEVAEEMLWEAGVITDYVYEDGRIISTSVMDHKPRI